MTHPHTRTHIHIHTQQMVALGLGMLYLGRQADAEVASMSMVTFKSESFQKAAKMLLDICA